MKTIRMILTISLSLLFVATIALAREYPKAVGFVNDFAHLLSKETAEKLNKDLIEFEKRTSIEIAVVTVTSLDGQEIGAYTRELATKWGVGKKDKNNGIVFLIALKERMMRLHAASGISSVFTDRVLDKIRDISILPHLKAGNMAQGIIEGSYAIMAVADSKDARSNTEGSATEKPQATPRAIPATVDPYQTDKIIIICLLIVVAVILCIFAIILPIRLSHARKDVLSDQNKFRQMLAKAENTAKNQDVKVETRNKLGIIQTEFAPIDQLLPASPNIKWTEARTKLNSLMEQLDDLTSTMRGEIAFGEKARKEGPELMKKIPEMIAATEKKLAEGKPSEEAIKHLDEARQKYAQTQSMQSGGMNMIDWVVLYIILTSINSNCDRAQEAHTYANTDHDSYTSPTESTPGFGESGGFGGGGGFEGGGGGSTGEF